MATDKPDSWIKVFEAVRELKAECEQGRITSEVQIVVAVSEGGVGRVHFNYSRVPRCSNHLGCPNTKR